MIEELKELVALVNSLPQLALWVAIGFWAYKVIIVGSIYGVIRYVAGQWFAWLRLRSEVRVKIDLDRFTMSSAVSPLTAQLYRVRGRKTGSTSYIHDSDVEWLRDAIDLKIEQDQQKANK